MSTGARGTSGGNRHFPQDSRPKNKNRAKAARRPSRTQRVKETEDHIQHCPTADCGSGR